MRRAALVLACLGLLAPGLESQVPPPRDSARATASEGSPIYSSDQARRGQSAYGKHCVNCHSPAAYTGSAFRRAWGNRSVLELWEQIRTTMPQDGPGKLSRQQYSDIVAYLLKLNGLPAGPTELPADADQLQPLVITLPRPED